MNGWREGASATRRLANGAALIENDMHSRREPCACKQSTYLFLIESEFHCADSCYFIRPERKLLDFPLTASKSTTSQFLIDNFERSLAFTAPKRASAKAGLSRRSRLSAKADHSRLSALDSRVASLIANETHSRADSTASKQSTYEFLIANEFHSPSRPAWPIMESRSALVPAQEASWRHRNP